MSSHKLTELTKVIRSKNAGPLVLTFDIIFTDPEVYKKLKEKNTIDKELIAALYQIDPQKIISIIYYDPAQAIKINIKRPLICGALGETDIYGAQQHAPLLDLNIPI